MISVKGAGEVTQAEQAQRFAEKAPPLNQAEQDAINAPCFPRTSSAALAPMRFGPDTAIST